MSHRIQMPIVDIQQKFTTVAELEDALASLIARTTWWLSTRSNGELREPYQDLAAYCWIKPLQDGFVAHSALCDLDLAEFHVPHDAEFIPFKGNWTLSDAGNHMRSDAFVAAFLKMGVEQFLADFAEGTMH